MTSIFGFEMNLNGVQAVPVL